MKPLIVLLVVYGLYAALSKVITGHWEFRFAGIAAMSVMLLFTSIGHFAYTNGMTMMMPAFIPFKKECVLLTGLIEISAATGLWVAHLRHLTGILLIIFFVLVLPVNIYGAIKKVNYQAGNDQGPRINYLWFRIPLQLFFIAWVWYFVL